MAESAAPVNTWMQGTVGSNEHNSNTGNPNDTTAIEDIDAHILGWDGPGNRARRDSEVTDPHGLTTVLGHAAVTPTGSIGTWRRMGLGVLGDTPRSGTGGGGGVSQYFLVPDSEPRDPQSARRLQMPIASENNRSHTTEANPVPLLQAAPRGRRGQKVVMEDRRGDVDGESEDNGHGNEEQGEGSGRGANSDSQTLGRYLRSAAAPAMSGARPAYTGPNTSTTNTKTATANTAHRPTTTTTTTTTTTATTTATAAAGGSTAGASRAHRRDYPVDTRHGADGPDGVPSSRGARRKRRRRGSLPSVPTSVTSVSTRGEGGRHSARTSQRGSRERLGKGASERGASSGINHDLHVPTNASTRLHIPRNYSEAGRERSRDGTRSGASSSHSLGHDSRRHDTEEAEPGPVLPFPTGSSANPENSRSASTPEGAGHLLGQRKQQEQQKTQEKRSSLGTTGSALFAEVAAIISAAEEKAVQTETQLRARIVDLEKALAEERNASKASSKTFELLAQLSQRTEELAREANTEREKSEAAAQRLFEVNKDRHQLELLVKARDDDLLASSNEVSTLKYDLKKAREELRQTQLKLKYYLSEHAQEKQQLQEKCTQLQRRLSQATGQEGSGCAPVSTSEQKQRSDQQERSRARQVSLREFQASDFAQMPKRDIIQAIHLLSEAMVSIERSGGGSNPAPT